MNLIHHGFEITELPTEWLAEAGVVGFVPEAAAYAVGVAVGQGRQVHEVRIEDVAPVRRTPGVEIFKDDPETGRTARERVVRILRGFRENALLPPVDVVPLPAGSVYKYKLVSGVHR